MKLQRDADTSTVAERGRAAPDAGTVRTTWTMWSAWAGVLGPVLFTAAYMAQEAYRGADFDSVALTVSALEAGPLGWIQQANFAVFGLLTIAFALGLHRGPRPVRAGFAGPALVLLSGVGLLLAAALPLRADAAGNVYDPGGHLIAGMTFFLGSAVGLLALAPRLARDPRWNNLAAYSAVAGAVALAAFVLQVVFVLPEGAPLHDWAGLAQRLVLLLVLFPCRIALSARLLRVARER
ncbi:MULTISPECIES: DUF998 domain-containing protein [unclassified Nocardiopsis]|uniref:DUF998 domain-containing protein n=1 Tax=unclassified Nocardiopsis TaxID=2649073 RepID=UPI0013570ED9|nr:MULTISPECIES: DUF998 domain-containing protein [unclassified Nocardiopsis]